MIRCRRCAGEAQKKRLGPAAAATPSLPHHRASQPDGDTTPNHPPPHKDNDGEDKKSAGPVTLLPLLPLHRLAPPITHNQTHYAASPAAAPT